MQAVSQEIKQADFIVHSKAIEIHGICAKCAQNMRSEQS
jgi:Fur family zinc uptake transcriptional regulator